MQSTVASDTRNFLSHFRSRNDPASQAVTNLFPVLFGSNFDANNESFRGFMEAIGTRFEVHPKSGLNQPAQNSFETQIMEGLNGLGLNESKQRARAFWLYLARVVFPSVSQHYRPLGQTDESYHNLFGFVMGFPLKETKVVIMGQDPSPKVNSSGYAFHLSPCFTTSNILGFVRDDFRQLGKFLVKKGIVRTNPFDVPSASISMANGNANLQDWIKQRVLLVNARLTIKDDCWDHFTTFLVRYLNEKCENVVFIFCGGDARVHAKLLNTKAHQVLRVRHPNGETKVEEFKWGVVRPFLKAAFYRYVKTGEVIDWLGVYFPEGTRLARQSLIKQAFDLILEEYPNAREDPNLPKFWSNSFLKSASCSIL